MTADGSLGRGRDAHALQNFDEAYALLSAADAEAPLGIDDLDRLADAAFLSGREHEGDDVLARMSRLALAQGEPAKAARAAFWLAFSLFSRGQLAQGGGWLGRAAHILEDAGLDSVEQGYLLIPAGLQAFEEGDIAGAHATFGKAAKIGRRFRDADLVAMAALGQGSSLIWLGETAEGVGLLDEAMVAVTTGEVTPVVAGIVYCGVIEACWDLFDVGRAAEWTTALTQWCASMPDQLPYRGQCRIHRSEILQLRGEWGEAEEEARLAGRRLEGWHSSANAHYQEAEVLRLRGRFAEAEEAYHRAAEAGRVPYPGLARLRLAQGRVDAAVSAMRRVLDEAEGNVARARLLGAFVDVMLAAGDPAAARQGADELTAIAAEMASPYLAAAAAYAEGAVQLSTGDCAAACSTLHRSLEAWRKLDAPYEVARVRTLLGLACRGVGDEDGARMERDAATRVFRKLGARPDLEAAEQLWDPLPPKETAGGLTSREVEVLALVATGRTNKAIAAELVISEKTVARHLSNIFTKLGLTSRSAATAYAYEHGLA